MEAGDFENQIIARMTIALPVIHIAKGSLRSQWSVIGTSYLVSDASQGLLLRQVAGRALGGAGR